MSKRLRKKHSVYEPAQSTSISSPRRLRLIQGGVVALMILIVVGIIIGRQQESFTPEVFGAPRAAFASESINHGDIPIEQFVEDEFVIKNVGDQQLRILDQPQIRVVEGCCPPAVHLDDEFLQPGEEATIHMQYTMHEGMAGQHLFEITVETNDPDNRSLVFTSRSNWIE